MNDPARTRGPHLSDRTYGVLVGTIVDGVYDPKGASPHYEIWVRAQQRNFRIAVNVRSTDGSEVLVHYDPAYALPTKRDLPARAAGSPGFTPLATGAAGTGLDYLHDVPPLFPITDMQALPPAGSGVSLANLLDGQIERAKADTASIVVAFGDSFSDPGADPTFPFSPETGVHDIHMMQGDTGTFASDNRLNGDGALFIRFTSGETIALFTRFATQTIAADGGAPPV